MKIFYTDHYVLPLPSGHRFPMEKYAMLRQRVENAGLAGKDGLSLPPAATDEQLLRAHDADYLHRVKAGLLSAAEQRRIGFPWSAQMVERSRRSSGATLAAASAALTNGVAVNLAGADPFEDDRLGRLKLTRGGLAERDRMVLELCHAGGIPVAVAMAGGYARRIEDTVDIHFATVRIAAEYAR